MTESQFNSFMHQLDEMVSKKKSNETIQVDIYDNKGNIICSSLDNDEYLGYRIIGGYLYDD